MRGTNVSLESSKMPKNLVFSFLEEWGYNKEPNRDLDEDRFSDINGHRQSLIGVI